MQRMPISESEYAATLEDLVIIRMHADVMSMTSGKHKDYGRVVLLQSGTGFVIIADDLSLFQRNNAAGGISATVCQVKATNNLLP